MKLLGIVAALAMLVVASSSLLAADHPKSDPCLDPSNAPKITTMANSIRMIDGDPSLSKADKDTKLAALRKQDSVIYKCASKTISNHKKRSGAGGASGALPSGVGGSSN